MWSLSSQDNGQISEWYLCETGIKLKVPYICGRIYKYVCHGNIQRVYTNQSYDQTNYKKNHFDYKWLICVVNMEDDHNTINTLLTDLMLIIKNIFAYVVT